ncbi:complex I intermediate-associated protein 30 mitochondrial [Crotalus adamanteus]|uniref:Complex I intermediate-associated protein 30, mitochondrial n=1 Tax=Crotalus adamanteus TaxID=8729 RepID=A0AAW1C6H4_CROAD
MRAARPPARQPARDTKGTEHAPCNASDVGVAGVESATGRKQNGTFVLGCLSLRSPDDFQSWTCRRRTGAKRPRRMQGKAIGGKSEICLKLDKNKQYAVLSGNLNTTVPRDGVTKYSGYCAMVSKPEMLAFHRTKLHDWSNFNSLCLRVRGDGRPWMLNINPSKYDPTSVKDAYNYFIFPRGGPYWEEIEVPFSKFFFTSHGRIQDGQYEMWSDRISTLGLTLADKVDGPFQLDIDFIGLLSDKSHTETFAYELYERNPQKQNK